MADAVNKVVIIGAGMAGLSAALRLLERGFEVTLYEQDDFVGGMMHSYKDPISGEWREHSYHMMSNWYHNFWKITEELGVRDNFEARDLFKYLYEGQYPEMTELVNAGAPQDIRCRQPARSGPDDANRFRAFLRRGRRGDPALVPCGIGNVFLDRTDGDRPVA